MADSITPGVKTPDLDTEVADRRRDPFETLYMGVLRTNDGTLIEKGGGDLAIYRDLKRDGKVFSGLQKRILALVGRPWTVEPVDSGRKTDGETVTEILRGFSFDQACRDLLDALIMGFSVCEIVWRARDGLICPERLVKRAQRRFVFQLDDEGAPQLRLLTRENMLAGEPLPERKFVVHRCNPEDDNAYGTGLGQQLYWPVFFKRKGVIAWNKLNDRFGTPTPWGRYPRNAGPKEKSTLFDALKSFSNDGVLMTPEGTQLDLIESKLTGSVSTQQSLCEYMDDWIAEVLIGQEPRANAGGAVASASKERQDVRLDLVQADADLLSDTLNRSLIRWICELNGLAPCLVSRPIKAGTDPVAQSSADKNVADMGFKLSLDAVRQKYGDGWEDAPVPAPRPPGGPGPGSANFAEPADALDAIDVLVDAAMADWQECLQPLVDPVRAALDASQAAGETAAQFLARLPGLLEKMDPATLHASLTRAAFTARLAGAAGIGDA